jgi:hypothetical protein
MRIEQHLIHGNWVPDKAEIEDADLVLLFGATVHMDDPSLYRRARAAWPGAVLFGCSTAGEIAGPRLHLETLVATALKFRDTKVRLAQVDIGNMAESHDCGRRLAALLPVEGLRHILLLSDGLRVNGTALVRGLQSVLPKTVAVTGGLSGDGTRFGRTLVCADAPPVEGRIAALGLYGERIEVRHGCLGGWEEFGPHRMITRAKGNILYELDGQSALSLYRKYLGDYADDLPASGLLFPLQTKADERARGLTRTLLAVNDEEQSMTFAGDLPEGGYARLMKTSIEHLLDGAAGAARMCRPHPSAPPAIAILISCVGRRLLLGQRVEEEIDAVQRVLGHEPTLAGFYSYGEVAPLPGDAACELHNQTMTITTLRES